ncbi:hypothetical protein cyc_05876 [Cyclospora cayetanensis]|uniref:Uncharacterized protein n=1 Tax=Cyclospora cayetanensis TaxID=88456 RepID=A0A1D3DAM5_9EIME|nr:hypothetical protein cyc_05876 [Cyclospora cayetanensis]
MCLSRCMALICLAVATLSTSQVGPVSVAASWDEREGLPEVDEADLDLNEDFVATPSATELAAREQEKQKNLYDQETTDYSEQFDVDDGDELEEETSKEVGVEVADLGGDIDLVDSLEDLEDRDVDMTVEQPLKNTAPDTVDPKPSGAEGIGEQLSGHIIQTKDEDGIELDTSLLTAEEYRFDPNIKEFIDTEKNRGRFTGDIENAEAELQAPESPGPFKRLYDWYDSRLKSLAERYGSEQKE